MGRSKVTTCTTPSSTVTSTIHVTHYLHRGENWAHLLSTHTHEHNRAELEHVHIPHTDVEKEHRREAHIHDHAPS
jgi:hypothetical protein